MKMSAAARFAISSWDEKPYGEGQDLPKLTRASVTRTYTGDIAGEGRVEYLMMYRGDGSAAFVGLERIIGRLAGKTGPVGRGSAGPRSSVVLAGPQQHGADVTAAARALDQQV